MQKKIIALAIAGALGSIAAGSAFADGASLYGMVDAGIVSRSGSDAKLTATSTGTRTEIASGVGAGSRIGVRGNEDLGNGLKAIFELEYGLSIDTGASSGTATSSSTPNQLWNRHSYVGLTGDFGTAIIGRVDGARYSWINKYEAFQGGTVGNSITMIGLQVSRADNAVAYISPTFADGFSVLTAYTNSLLGQENSAGVPPGGVATQNTNDVKLWVLAPQYNNGPLSAVLNFEGSNVKDQNSATTALNLSVFDAGASYDFGVAKLFGFYDAVHNDATPARTIDFKAWGISASAPVTPAFLVRAGYTKLTDDTANAANCNKFAIGATYTLSKMTYIGTDYASIGGINGGGTYGNGVCQMGYSGTQGAADITQTPDQSRYGTHGFDLFISHKF